MQIALPVFFWPIAALLVHVHFFFLIALLKKDNSVADIAWGLGFVLVVWVAALMRGFGQLPWIVWLVVVMVTVWGTRLASHIYVRNKGKKEDWRYNQWRQDWGEWWLLRSYLQVFLLQGFFLLIIVSPAWYVVANGVAQLWQGWWQGLVYLGGIIWSLGFFFEAVGDYQLMVFKNNPKNKGKIMTRGLWRYTRHPNYFGEAILWWGVWLPSLALPWGWLTVLGPLLIDFMLLKVSGIPMLEKKYESNVAFEKYKQQTSAFFPLPPKK